MPFYVVIRDDANKAILYVRGFQTSQESVAHLVNELYPQYSHVQTYSYFGVYSPTTWSEAGKVFPLLTPHGSPNTDEGVWAQSSSYD